MTSMMHVLLDFFQSSNHVHQYKTASSADSEETIHAVVSSRRDTAIILTLLSGHERALHRQED